MTDWDREASPATAIGDCRRSPQIETNNFVQKTIGAVLKSRQHRETDGRSISGNRTPTTTKTTHDPHTHDEWGQIVLPSTKRTDSPFIHVSEMTVREKNLHVHPASNQDAWLPEGLPEGNISNNAASRWGNVSTCSSTSNGSPYATISPKNVRNRHSDIITSPISFSPSVRSSRCTEQRELQQKCDRCGFGGEHGCARA